MGPAAQAQLVGCHRICGGAAFFIAVGSSTRPINIVIGGSVLLMVIIQTERILRKATPAAATPLAAAGYGVTGGFTTFVANAAGPVMNTYLLRLGYDKQQMVGTAAWFYFTVNVSKIPVYIALGAWTAGGHFFTADGLQFDLLLLPAVLIGVFTGRRMFNHLPQGVFVGLVLVLSAAGAVKLLIP